MLDKLFSGCSALHGVNPKFLLKKKNTESYSDRIFLLLDHFYLDKKLHYFCVSKVEIVFEGISFICFGND